MITIILPGYSKENREWAEEVKEKINLDHDIVIHKWQHWPTARRASGSESQTTSFSVAREKKRILDKVGDRKINIIAKSVGTRVLMHLLPKIHGRIGKVILCGIPTKFESDKTKNLYKKGLTLLSSAQVVVFQNVSDPLANYSVIEKFIHSVNPKIEVIKMPRSDHHYPYHDEFKSMLL